FGNPGAPPPSEPWQVAQLFRNRLRPTLSAAVSLLSSTTLRGEYGASAFSMRAALSFESAACSACDVQPNVPFHVPRPGYSTKYTRPNTTVMMNSHSHQRGNGLFNSCRSSSQTWPVVCSVVEPSPGERRVHHSSQMQPAMLASVRTMMKMLCPVVTAMSPDPRLLRAEHARPRRTPARAAGSMPRRSATRTAPAAVP